MPGPTNPYIYQPTDDPISLANQFGLTPQQLLAANPGGFPFSTGQRINLPFQPRAEMGYSPRPTPYTYSGPANAAPPGYASNYQAPQTPGPATAPNSLGGVGNVPYGPQRPPGNTPAPGINYMLGRGGGQTAVLPKGLNYQRWTPGLNGGGGVPDPTKPYGGFTNDDPTNTDYKNTKAAQYYEATGTPFLDQKRWDPGKKKYISIRQWMKGSRRGGGGGGGGGGKQKKQEFAIANSIIDFGLAAG
jgi:hypothetical protein